MLKIVIPNLGSQSLKKYFSFSNGRGDTVIKSSDYRIRLSGILGKAQKPLFALVSLPNRVVIEIGYCGNYNVLLKWVWYVVNIAINLIIFCGAADSTVPWSYYFPTFEKLDHVPILNSKDQKELVKIEVILDWDGV